MGTSGFTLPPFPLEQALTDMGDRTKELMRAGFRRIAALDNRQIEILAHEAIDHIDSLEEIDPDQLAAQLGVGPSDLYYAISAISLSVALISSRTDPVSEITDRMVKAGLFDDPTRASISRFLEMLANRRAEIAKSISLRGLADETLPAFKGFEASVDVRLGFKKDQIEAIVPVLLVHLRTDLDSAKLFFQMSKADVHRLAEQLRQFASRMDQAEEWAGERFTKGA